MSRKFVNKFINTDAKSMGKTVEHAKYFGAIEGVPGAQDFKLRRVQRGESNQEQSLFEMGGIHITIV